MLWTKHFLYIVHSHCFHKKTILKESISFSNEKRSLSYSCWKGFALISVIWRFLLRWVNCFIDKAPPDCKDKHRNFQINAFCLHIFHQPHLATLITKKPHRAFKNHPQAWLCRQKVIASRNKGLVYQILLQIVQNIDTRSTLKWVRFDLPKFGSEERQ
mgnify:CR=1 FL=1